MPDHFINPETAIYFASKEGTPAMSLYRRWKCGETLHVRTVPLVSGTKPLVFEIQPVRYIEIGPVVGVTILVDGKPVPEHAGLILSTCEFLDWAATLEEIE